MKQLGFRYTVYMTDEGWLAEAHCDCGSTVTGSPQAQTTDAITGARRSLERHIARARIGSSCGTRNHDPALRLEDETKAAKVITMPMAPAFLAKLDEHGGGDGEPPGMMTENIDQPVHAGWPYMVIR